MLCPYCHRQFTSKYLNSSISTFKLQEKVFDCVKTLDYEKTWKPGGCLCLLYQTYIIEQTCKYVSYQ